MEATAAAREPDADNELPPCYGLYWEAIGDSPCTRCEVRRRCLHSFATGELTRLQAELGADAGDLAKLASVSQVKAEALRVAIAYANKAGREKPARPAAAARSSAVGVATAGERSRGCCRPDCLTAA